MPIQRGEIYFVNLNPVEGREQAGNRPVLIQRRHQQTSARRNGCGGYKGSEHLA